MFVKVSSYPIFNILFENIIQDILKYRYRYHDHDSNMFIGGRPIRNLRFADDINLIADLSNELQKRTDYLAKSAPRYGMEINHEKSKIIINDPNKGNSNNLKINMY